MIDQLLKLFPALQAGKKITKFILLGLVVYMGIVGTTGFACFILEEAAQARGFGPYMLIQSKQWEEAKLATDECLRMWRRDTIAVTFLSLPSPVGFAYRRYFESEKVKLDAQLKRIEFELEKLNKKADTLLVNSNNTNSIPEKHVMTDNDLKPLSEINLSKTAIRPARDIQKPAPGEDKPTEFVKTRSGQCYHLTSCGVVRGKDVIAVKRSEIGKLRACKVCMPSGVE